MPWAVATDIAGNVYFSEPYKHRVRKIDVEGNIFTIAGNGTSGRSGDNYPATDAQLNTPYGIAADGQGNLYIADYGNNRIRKVNPAGIIYTCKSFAFKPMDITLDTTGNLYVAEEGSMTVSKTTPAGVASVVVNGFSNVLPGGAYGVTSDLWQPQNARLNGLTIAPSGNVYIADHWDNLIRKVSPAGVLSTISGAHPQFITNGDGGPAGLATLNGPRRLATDKEGNIYVSDGTIRKINTAGIISTVAGGGIGQPTDNNIMATDARLTTVGIAVDNNGNLYIADVYYNTIRKVRPGNVGVNHINKISQKTVYPNPNNGLFCFTATYSEQSAGNTFVEVMNAAGTLVYTTSTESKNGAIIARIDICNQPAGIYFLKATTATEVINSRFMVVK
jgi:hypothetical protein